MTETSYLNKNSVVYSFGVGDDISWDLALLQEVGCDIHAFDPTPYSIEWVSKQQLPPQFHFHPYGVADYDGVAGFNPKMTHPNNKNLSMSIFKYGNPPTIPLPVKRLSTIMKELGHDHIDVLKMDIEGTEYPVIRDMKGIPIRQFLVEMHNPTSKRLWYPIARARLWWRGYHLQAHREQDHTFIKTT